MGDWILRIQENADCSSLNDARAAEVMMSWHLRLFIQGVEAYSVVVAATDSSASSSRCPLAAAACEASMVTHTISTKSTHNSRFSVGISPYVIQWVGIHSFSPLTISGTVDRFISDPMFLKESNFMSPRRRMYVLFQIGPHIVWSTIIFGTKLHHSVKCKTLLKNLKV